MTRTFKTTSVQPPAVKVWRLYRVWRADGVLLYIGITGREPLARLIEHIYEQAWSHEIARWELDDRVYATEAEVLAAEETAIKAEKPLRNWQHNAGPHRQWQPKVATYRHPGRRGAPAAVQPAEPPAKRVLRSPWTWWAIAWVATTVTAWIAIGAALDGIGHGLTPGWHLLAAASAGPGLYGLVRVWWWKSGRRRWRRLKRKF